MSRGERSAASWVRDLADANSFRVRMPDGRELGATEPRFVLWLKSERAARRLARSASALGVGEAWIDGDLDIDGDILAAMEVLHGLDSPDAPMAMRVLGAIRRATRAWRDPRRDIAVHYDLPSAFYELFLDRRMVYTCAYYRDAGATLDEAQEDKLDLVCRKLSLSQGDEFLDLGCGWGALACWAARHYGVRAHAITLSREQAAWASSVVAREGLGDRVRVEHLDYRSLPASPRYDKIAAVGVIEHVGRHAYAGYFSHVRSMLRDGGLFLNHGITMRPGASWSSGMEFLHRHVFPGLDLVDIAATLSAVEGSGMEVLDVENLRPHYARTTRDWVARLQARRAEASAIAGERAWRIWTGYLAAASVAFREGWIGLDQVVARRDAIPGDGSAPILREQIYGGAGQEPRPHQYQAMPRTTRSSSQ